MLVTVFTRLDFKPPLSSMLGNFKFLLQSGGLHKDFQMHNWQCFCHGQDLLKIFSSTFRKVFLSCLGSEATGFFDAAEFFVIFYSIIHRGLLSLKLLTIICKMIATTIEHFLSTFSEKKFCPLPPFCQFIVLLLHFKVRV